MADAWKARPVSGEIMTAARAAAARPRAGAGIADDIVDAEFETLVPEIGPAERTEAGARPAFVPDVPPVHGMDMLRRAEAEPKPNRPRRGGPFFWLVGLTLAAAAFWVSGGHALVMRPAVPTFESSPAQARLRIDIANSRVDRAGDRIMLFVDGEAVNDGAIAVPLPPIQIAVTAQDGRVTRYNLGTADQVITPGGRFSFSSRLEVPRNGVKSVSVNFKERGNADSTGQGY